MQIVYLDIETTELPFKSIPMKDIRIAVAGTRWHGIYTSWNDSQIEEMVNYIENADLIVGHNIFSFDYRIIGNYFQDPEVRLGAKGRGIRSKTVDTQMRWAEFVGKGKPNGYLMALDNMCTRTFGSKKSIEGKLIPDMWKAGKYQEVINHNKECLIMVEQFYLAGCAGTKILYDHKVYGKSEGEKEIFLKW